ncbi:MAG: penicillin-binding protein 1C [Rhodospirillaceae bacterium]|nr:penicillin-binding protein 1C [Rhodospirillaceae bacterium]
MAFQTAVAAADIALPPDLTRAARSSPVVLDRRGAWLRALPVEDGRWRLRADLARTDPEFLRRVVAAEDARFWVHPGVDPAALARAVGSAVARGHATSGASTITMQTARLLEPRPRTVGSKLIEMLRALQLEARFSKREILAMYLTLAPYGGNLEGVRAASLSYFGHEPEGLTDAEQALLIALPQSPAATRPDRSPAAAKAARDKILTVLEERGVISPAMAREARAEPVPRERRTLPFLAPHATDALRQRHPGQMRIVSTLDRRLQEAMETLAKSEIAGLAPEANVAILVADHTTGEIRAYVGSAEFFSVRRQGQVDMVPAIRSPGSTLKPFVYGIAFDLGLVHPNTIVTDGPTRFGDYRPENFQRVYMGEVTIRTALQQSLNVPAVAVLDGIGPERFTAVLRNAGITLRFDDPAEKPGLPVVLGGVGTSLGDLVTLYAGLGHGGVVRKLRLDPEEAPAEGRRILSAASAWQIARILESAPPPADAVPRDFLNRPFDIAYKTGTSYGYRDAWAVGYDGRYTVGVWVGRPDGTPSPDHFGRNTALPILFKAFDLLPESRDGTAGRAMPIRPPEALVASNEALPPTLRRYAARSQRIEIAGRRPSGPALAISFPPAGATVALERKKQAENPQLFLVAEGGTQPLRWLVNGRPIDGEPGRRQAFWKVDGEGFVRVTVVDADGHSASVQARIKIY